MSQLTAHTESFRDHLSILDEKGKRRWIYPRFQKGRIFTLRNLVAYTLLAAMMVCPFIHVKGHPLFLFNVVDRIFIIWGVPFFPQDFFLFGLAMLSFIVFIILFTTLFGRWWCGWACPQTIFMEFIFRRIEYWIEGDAQQRRNLDRSEWNLNKLWKKIMKHSIFFIISFLISNIFLSYIIGIDELKRIVLQPASQHLGGLITVIIFSAVFYLVFAWLREQVCIGVCPYGRLQGVLLDKDSMAVSYDFIRGEPRGKLHESGKGDCIDCNLCVAVCPTGIDIRNGTQLECINCAACVDACNSIMEKIQKPQGLIRNTSYNQIIHRGEKPRFTLRMGGYSILWIAMMIVLSYLTFSRPVVDVTILRAPGQLYQKKNDSTITNLYTINMVNKSFDDHKVELKIASPGNAFISVIEKDLFVGSAATSDGAFFIEVPFAEIQKVKTTVNIDVMSRGYKIDEVSTTFIAPVFK